jgi:hypothetical protein
MILFDCTADVKYGEAIQKKVYYPAIFGEAKKRIGMSVGVGSSAKIITLSIHSRNIIGLKILQISYEFTIKSVCLAPICIRTCGLGPRDGLVENDSKAQPFNPIEMIKVKVQITRML